MTRTKAPKPGKYVELTIRINSLGDVLGDVRVVYEDDRSASDVTFYAATPTGRHEARKQIENFVHAMLPEIPE